MPKPTTGCNPIGFILEFLWHHGKEILETGKKIQWNKVIETVTRYGLMAYIDVFRRPECIAATPLTACEPTMAKLAMLIFFS